MTGTQSSQRIIDPLSAASGALSVSRGYLPADILKDASRRLKTASLLYAAAYAVGYFGPPLVASFFVDESLSEMLGQVETPFALVAIVLSLGFFLVAKYGRLEPPVLLDLGLIYEVVAAFGMAIGIHWGVDYPQFEGVPWEAVWILVFPILAPNTPGKVLLASLAAASTGFVSVLLSKSVGASPNANLVEYGVYFIFTNFLCAGIAYISSRTIYRFGRRLKAAQEIGSYELVDPLGLGGMGEVWVAHHRLLARPAAIKLIRPELISPDAAGRKRVTRRFEKEAKATAALRSCHTVELYDFGTSEDGSFYYVMELLNGLNLDALVARFGPVPAERAVHFLRQVCHSLDEAHANGLIHRDIKPANIYSCRLGLDYDFVKVLDFGIVKSTHELQTTGSQLTQEGSVPGTPAFMAPEMADGGEIDGRADLYSLGCVAYWLLTGQLVFQKETALAMIVQHMQAQPVPPSRRTELEIPEALERVVLACLEKDPADRPRSASELDALLAASLGERSWSRERAEEWWRLHVPETVSLGPEDVRDAVGSRWVRPLKPPDATPLSERERDGLS